MQSNRLDAFIQSNDTLAHLQQHASRLLKLQRIYEEIAPAHLAQSSWIANLKVGVLVIHAFNGAVAAKLNQLKPRFVDDFLKRGVDLTGIEVRLQVAGFRPAGPPREVRPVPDTAKRALANLESNLPEGSPLRDVLARFRASDGN
ncbi:MAG: DUF721 domain-containing protein [Rhodocyclaceae bacterium]|nr:DUF721 domain-containing protein [Rhodocyclaceae bacterium]